MIDLAVSDEVISDFAKAVVRKDPEPEFITVNGIARKYDDEWMIELDGSQQLTPIASSAVGLNDGDRVTAQIKNHSLSVTGNLTGKTTTQQDTIAIKKEIDDRLDKHDSKITEVEDLMATKVNTDELNAQKGRIDQLVSDNATIREKLTATDASIDKLDADVVDINDSLTAKQADIDSLKTSKIDATVADAKYATIGDLDAANASINNLDANYADFKKTTTDTLDAVDANIKKLNTDKLNVTDAAAKYANIDFANIGEAAIKAFYAKSGVISDVVISDGHVTGKLVGVTIKGDLIEGGTVVADKLVMLGEDGLYYKLNTNGKTVSSEQTEYNSLNGSIITAKSITAEKVNVNDLVAFGATIGGLHISNGSLYSGAKNAVSNTTNGVYMDFEGQFALGNASNFLKFYKDSSGKWKLVISANAMTLGTGGSVEDAINESAKTVTLQYYRSTSATSLVGGSWADSSPDWVDGTYIWTRSKSVDRAGNATYSEPACITGNTGPQGKQGIQGVKGADGVGVKDTTVTYQSSSSGTTIPTGTWSSGIPSVPEGSFLWTRIVYSYSNGTSTTAYSVGKMGAKGDKGDKGATGNTGAPGAAGRGIKSSSVTYQVGNSQTTVPTGSWATSVPKLSSATPYLWTRTILTYTDNTSTTAYSVGTTLDGVNVGGRNLLRGTDYEINTHTTKSTDNATWGSGFDFNKYANVHGSDYQAFVPYGYSYRASVDVLIPVDGNIVIDINNYAPEGEDNWSGNDNDNDNINYRTSTTFSVKANIWTRLSWGSENTASGNTKKLPIRIMDSVGLLPQSSDVTWSYRGLKVELGNTATDWSPAPEDVATDIADAANTAANALEKANNNEKNITEATKAILDIQENIKALVTGPNGSSLMTQTNKGWTFDMSSIERTLNEATDDITNLNSNLSATNDILNSTKKLLDDVTKKTAYINFATDDSGNPCIELGKQDNPFKLRITNTSIDFMQGSQKIAYLTNHQLYIESSVITDSILIGQNGTFIWKKRANNHLGLRYT